MLSDYLPPTDHPIGYNNASHRALYSAGNSYIFLSSSIHSLHSNHLPN